MTRNGWLQLIAGATILVVLICCYAIITHATGGATGAGVAVALGIYIAGCGLWVAGERVLKRVRQ